MKNYVAEGDLVDYTASGSPVNSGDFVFVSAYLWGFATNNIAVGATGALKTKGVFNYTKNQAEAWTVGAAVYWDNTNKVFTIAASGNTKVGVALLSAANPSATGRIKLFEAA
jgi:predicted RecA/RadA family phage recombinase